MAAFPGLEQWERCAQLCGCSSDRNDIRVVTKSQPIPRSSRTNVVLPSPRTMSSLSPADGFTQLEQLRQDSLGRPVSASVQNTVQNDCETPPPDDPSSVGGVGIVFQPFNDKLIVKGLRGDSPAAKSGLVKIGDRLISVNETPVAGMSAKELACALLGPIGTKVTLHFMRGKSDVYPYSIEVIRIRIRSDSTTPTEPAPRVDPERGSGAPQPYGPLLMSKGKPMTFRKVLAARSANVDMQRRFTGGPPAAPVPQQSTAGIYLPRSAVDPARAPPPSTLPPSASAAGLFVE